MYIRLHLCFTMPLSSLIKMKSLKLRSQKLSHCPGAPWIPDTWRLPLPSDQVSDQTLTRKAVGISESRWLQHPQACDNSSQYPEIAGACGPAEKDAVTRGSTHYWTTAGPSGKRQPEVGKGVQLSQAPGSCLLHLDNGQERRKSGLEFRRVRGGAQMNSPLPS